jgi:hypothetical protein
MEKSAAQITVLRDSSTAITRRFTIRASGSITVPTMLTCALRGMPFAIRGAGTMPMSRRNHA